MSTNVDILVLALASVLGNVGVALTGLGMAIIFIFVWQIAIVCGYDGDFKYAIFIQALALLSIQPLALHKANVKEHASRKILKYFIPITIISTPLGQMVGNYAPTTTVQGIGGILILFVSTFQLVKNNHSAWKKFCRTENIDKTDDLLQSSLFSEGSIHDSYNLTQTMVGFGLTSIVSVGFSIDDRKDNFAVKTIKKSQFSQKELDVLKQEVFLLSTFSHANIVPMIESFDETAEMTIVFELMKGEDLFTRLSRRSYFDESECRHYFQQMLSAVVYIHGEKVAHRDIKPEQFLFSSHKEDAILKLSDFGFAKRCSEKSRSKMEKACFRTMCGTPCYASPELLSGNGYGLKTDVWSLGVTLFTMLAGYQPFQEGEEEEGKEEEEEGIIDNYSGLYKRIMNDDITFKSKHWKSVSKEAQSFILSLLNKRVSKRLSSEQAAANPWVTTHSSLVKSDTQTVFFMIGSQRSGSNWLRTLIDEREDIAAPHPPHIMRDFMPIISKFGDLSNDKNFRVLVDHVCILVERNQVQWNDLHGSKMLFPRLIIYNKAIASLKRLEREEVAIDSTYYLLSIFDAIMTHYAESQGKRYWMCKSMGMSMYHNHLLHFYGDKRLRYVYLVRDPRDVVLSFMNTPVGDCHPYAISLKWERLQRKAMDIVEKYPHLVYKLKYESLLTSKEATVTKLFEFLGIRSFSQLKRQTSIMAMRTIDEVVTNAKNGKEATKASTLSYQFQNLCKGEEFATNQLQKWRDPSNGMTQQNLRIVESITFEVMKKLGYDPALFTCSPPTQYSIEDIAHFSETNEDMIMNMMSRLKKENPGDFKRRQYQSDTFGLELKTFGDWSDFNQGCKDSPQKQKKIPLESLKSIVTQPSCEGSLKNGRKFIFGNATRKGYDPCNSKKKNQDSSHFSIVEGDEFGSLDDATPCFGMYDGHGKSGRECSFHASRLMETTLSTCLQSEVLRNNDEGEIKSILERAFEFVHQQLTSISNVDTKLSGSTAVVLILNESHGIIANAGDSFCAVGRLTSKNMYDVMLRTNDHTPLVTGEAERIRNSNGEILTTEQRNDLEPVHTFWENGDVPRVWKVGKNLPGVAFTRSLGDEIAHEIGVTSCPESTIFELPKSRCAIVLASDGISEYLSDKECLNVLHEFDDPAAAANKLVSMATQRWVENGDYMDDITAIVIFLEADSDWIQEQSDGTIGSSVDIEMGVNVGTSKNSKLGMEAIVWTLFAGFASGFLGGLCAIRGPPIILYFLNPPGSISFTKESQRATGTCITFVNVLMRVIFYIIETLFVHDEENQTFDSSERDLYVAVIASSIIGALIGSLAFTHVKNKDVIKWILSGLLVLSGVSLIITAFR